MADFSQELSLPEITIRISTADRQNDMDWMVRPDMVNFRQSLEVISNVVQNTSITAFEYDDEDSERITVRSDDELQTMLTVYFNRQKEEDLARGLLPPLIVYPKVGKTPQHRNIHHLTIKTRKSPIASNGETVQSSGNIKDILSCGNIVSADLQFIDFLGSGNSGKVNKALHIPTRKLMAVKVILLDANPVEQERIISELEILCKCKSPVIIGFYGAFFVENRISLCTEFMDGGSLDKFGQIPQQVLGKIAVSIVHGLQYLWALKILHRDVKPSNILVNSSGEVKLCDFGVSTQLVKSVASTYVGTNAYMAPERLEAQEYGTAADVWSLGVSLFELATGRFPFQLPQAQNKPGNLMKEIVENPPPRLPLDIFPADLIDFVAQCMQTSPVARLSASDLMTHPYIHTHALGDTQIVAAWVHSHICQKKS